MILSRVRTFSRTCTKSSRHRSSLPAAVRVSTRAKHYERKQAADSVSHRPLQPTIHTHQPSNGAARAAQARAGGGAASAAMGEAADVRERPYLTLTNLHHEFTQVLRLIPHAYRPQHDQQQQQNQRSIVPPRSLEAYSTASLVAAALPLATNLLLLLQQVQAGSSVTEKKLHLHQRDSAHGSSGISSRRESSSNNLDDAERRLLGECLNALAVVVEGAGCPAAAATQPAAARTAEAPPATREGASDAQYVKGTRLAVLLLQCLLHAGRQQCFLEPCLVLPHIQAAANYLAASLAAQLELQQHHKRQLHDHRPSELWVLHQQAELAVLMKRSVRLLGALLSNAISAMQQQTKGKGCPSPSADSSFSALQAAPEGAAPSDATIAAAAANLSAIHRLLEAAVDLVQLSQLPPCQQSGDACPLDAPASLAVAAKPKVAGGASAECIRTFTDATASAERELRHLPPLLLWLVPSFWSAAQRAGVSRLHTPWVAVTRLAEQQQQQMQHLQLPDLSLLLLATARISALHQECQQPQHQTPVATDCRFTAAAACRQQLRRLATGCSLRGAALLSLKDGAEAPQTQAAPSLRPGVTVLELEAQAQQQQQHQPHKAHQEQQQRQQPWLRQSCIILLALTRLLQQEQLLLPGVVRHPHVQTALVNAHDGSSSISHSSDSNTYSRTPVHQRCSDTAALAAAAVTFMSALARRLTAAEWLPPLQRHKRCWSHQRQNKPQRLQQHEDQQHQQRQAICATASAATANPSSAALGHSSVITKPSNVIDSAAPAHVAASGQQEELIMSGRDFAQLLHCFVSSRFLPVALLQKSLAFLAAYPPGVGVMQSPRCYPSAAAASSEALSLRVSPQDAGLLLWAVGVACASGASQGLQWHCTRDLSVSYSIACLPTWRQQFAGSFAATADRPFSTQERLPVSAEVQFAVQRHLRQLAAQLLLSEGSKGFDATCGVTSRDSYQDGNTNCRPDTQAVANAIWGLACCGLLGRRLLRAMVVLPSFRYSFRRCSNSAEKMQVLRAILLQRLQCSRAPAAAVAAAARTVHPGHRRHFSASAGAVRQRYLNWKSMILTERQPQKHQWHPQQQEQQGKRDYQYLCQQGGHHQQRRRKTNRRILCNVEDACSVRPSLLQQEVLREVQHLLQQPVAAALAPGATTATAVPSTVAVLHECAVWPGLYVDIGLVVHRQSNQQSKSQEQDETSIGRLRRAHQPLRIAIEVDGPSHFLLDAYTSSGKDSNNNTYSRSRQNASSSCSSTDVTKDSSSTSSSSCSNSVTLLLRADGGTALKHRLLRLLGWRVIHVSFVEWQQLQGRRDLQQQLLLRHTELRQLLGLQRRARSKSEAACVRSSRKAAQQETRLELQHASS